MTIHEVFQAVERNNINAGGNVLERHAERAIVRGVGLIKSLRDIEQIIVKESGGTPFFVRDVAEAQIGHAVRHGAAVLNGEREVVAGVVLMLRGGNARDVVESVNAKVAQVHQEGVLPAGMSIVPFYDRIELVTAAINTVRDALIEGIVLVAFVFLLFLGNIRSAIVVTSALIITPLITFIVMERVGLLANLMTLGGLAIAVGEIADGSVVVVENVYRHLAENRHTTPSRIEVVLRASKEVARSILFGILIISVVFLPLLTLEVRRRIYIGFNVVGHDIGSVIDEGRKKLDESVLLPQGYWITWGGAFENMERANARLLVVVPVTIGLIFFLLFWTFHSLRYAIMIILNLPFALVGGVVSLWLSGQYLSVPATIGFIELFGLAVGNGIVLVSYINQLRNEGMTTDQAILSGCILRLRPVLMTMLTTLFGLFPLVVSQGIGAEVQRPLASVVIGGLFSSTFLTLVVLPALYRVLAEKEQKKEYAPDFV